MLRKLICSSVFPPAAMIKKMVLKCVSTLPTADQTGCDSARRRYCDCGNLVHSDQKIETRIHSTGSSSYSCSKYDASKQLRSRPHVYKSQGSQISLCAKLITLWHAEISLQKSSYVLKFRSTGTASLASFRHESRRIIMYPCSARAYQVAKAWPHWTIIWPPLFR